MQQYGLEITLLIIKYSFLWHFVIGDGHSREQLCGRYKNYSHHIARLSQACDVSFDNSNNPDWVCNYLKMSALQELSIHALELSGFILNEKDDAMPIYQ